jgi:hypothetical protein
MANSWRVGSFTAIIKTKATHPRRHKMALERPPKYLALNPEGVKSYRPQDSEVSKWHTVGPNEGWITLQEKYGVPAARIIQFNFPGAAEQGKIVPEIVNWYLHHHRGFGCPETRDGKNRRFKGGERVAIPFLGSVELGEPVIRERLRPSDVWIGIGEAHSGDLVALGYFNWNARIYRLGANEEGDVEWATLTSHGCKLGGGLGGSGGLVVVFAHGVDSLNGFRSAFAWGDMDFDLALIGQLSSVLKGLRGISKVIETMDKYKKLSYTAEEILKNKAFVKKGVYTIPIPLAGVGVHVWVGRKYAETMVVGSGKGL